MAMGRWCIIAGLSLCAALANGAESYEEHLAGVDRSDPNSLFELVEWCRDNGFHSSANKHIREILALDPNHGPTRELQGFVFDGKRWIHKSRLSPEQLRAQEQNQGPAEPALSRRQASGPGPSRDDIEWDFSIPAVPESEKRYRPFIATVIKNMNGQDIFAMEGNWRTLIREAHRNESIAQLATGIMDGSYTDLWGPAMIATTLYSEGTDASRAQAVSLLPFLVKQSQRNKNADAQLAFAALAAQIGDLRAVPQLIALLDSGDIEFQSAARQALSTITFCPEAQLDLAFVKDWWARHHNSSQATILSESLNDPNPWIRLSAARSLSNDTWDARVMGTLIRLARSDEARVIDATDFELKRLTGNDWGLTRANSSEDRLRITGQLQEWWQENRSDFVPVALRGKITTTTAALDQIGQWVQQLSDTELAAAATAQIRRRGKEAIASLITVGLTSKDAIVRNRARDILREISEQNFNFEGIRGSDSDRQEAINKWRNWAQAEGHLP